jgi:translocation and assembly module TamB
MAETGGSAPAGSPPPEKKRPPPNAAPPSGRKHPRLGRAIALALCVLFSVIGAIPLLGAFLVRTRLVQDWAASETSRVLEQELGTRARFDVRVTPWPLTVAIESLEIEGDDGLGAFLTLERASITPRIFSLLAGKLDVGDVEINGAHARIVMRNGELTSFRPKVESSSEESSAPIKPPFRAFAVTDASLDIDIDGVIGVLRETDVDLLIEEDGAFEIGARAGGGSLTRVHADPRYPSEDMADEDRLCKLEARARFDMKTGDVLVRRLLLDAAVDFDPDAGTRPDCDLDEQDWRRLSLRLGAVHIPRQITAGTGFELLDGRALVSVPLPLAHRFLSLTRVTGRAELDVEAQRAPYEKSPLVTGKLHAEFPGIDSKVFSDRVDAGLRFDGKELSLSDLAARWADGDFKIPAVHLKLDDPSLPLEAHDIVADHVGMQGLLRDLSVHPQSHVGWDIDHVDIPHFVGTLNPLSIEGKLTAKTKDFGIYDRPSHRPDRGRMISVSGADVTGILAIRPEAVVLEGMHAKTPRSEIFTTVKLGYAGELGLEVAAPTRVDLAEISPLVSVQIGGVTSVVAEGTGTFDYPRIAGDISVDAFSLGGFAAGDVEHAKALFVPLSIELTDVELHKNQSVVHSSRALVDFDAGADVLVDADVQTTQAPHLKIRDFFEVFHFDQDPRFAAIAGTAVGTAEVHYALGGPEDRCGGGLIDVKTKMAVSEPELFGESFEKGAVDVRFRYDDAAAGSAGMEIDLTSASMQDGTGSLSANAEVRHGGHIRGTVVAAGLPLSRLESFGKLRDFLDGEVSAVGNIGGTLAQLEADLDVSLSPLRFGANKLPGSRLSVKVEPDRAPPDVAGQSRCGQPMGPPFSLVEWQKDLPSGLFRINGQLFGGQIALDNVTITRQSASVVRGRAVLDKLDLGTMMGALPSYALSGQPPAAHLSAAVDLTRLDSKNLAATDATVTLTAIDVARGGRSVKLLQASRPIEIENGNLVMPKVELELGDKSGLRLGFSADGRVDGVFGSAPKLEASLGIAPFDLASLKGELPGVDRIAGMLSGSLRLEGDISAPKVTGFARLRDGALAISDVPALEKITVDISVGDGELRVTRANAAVGAGSIDVTGRIPVVGFGLGAGTANVTARGLKLPVGEGIDVVADADLVATIPPTSRTDGALPELQGTVSVTSFTYKRPIALSLDLGALSRSIGRNEAQAVDPDGDFLRFALRIVSPRPLLVANDLADIRLEVVEPGIELAGTNQRYGAKGALRLLPDSKLRLRNHEFDVREGYVRFDDPKSVKADIDVRATTDLRRYAQSEAAGDGGSTTAGQWDVSVHAHGNTDNLRLDLSSDPPLDQEDIVLLLAVGMTRAEIDRGLATSLGETVGLEALSALTGADKAVKQVVPIIDYFHFGSSYSSRTGRTEPNVTVGKRLTDDVRASVTTTLTERDVAATVEWRLKKGVSLQGSYDNTNDIGTIIGNLGADLRWRLEFE